MTVKHTLIQPFIDQTIAISWTRINLCWSRFRIIGHTLVFKLQKRFHDKYRKSLTYVTTVGVDTVQATLPHGPNKPPENVLGTDLRYLDLQLRALRSVRLLYSDFGHLRRTVGVSDFRLAGNFVLSSNFTSVSF